jgi:hypothetical protein
MLTAVALAVAVLISPISVSVHAATDLPRALVESALDEADAIWRAADVIFSWEIADGAGGSLSTLRVTIGDYGGPEGHTSLAIGWIGFDNLGAPTPDIYLSYRNAMELVRLEEGRAAISRMTEFERRVRLTRVLGRALAHELGHYLLASKMHTPAGLMKAKRPASDFLGPRRSDFEVDLPLRSLVKSRLVHADGSAPR